MWWSDAPYLLAGVVIVSPPPDLLLWSNTLDHSLGGGGGTPSQPICLGSLVSRGATVIDQLQRASSHSFGFYSLQHSLVRLSVGVFCDNTKAFVQYISPLYNLFFQGFRMVYSLRDLVRSFELECPRHPPDPSACDLIQVLNF